MDRPEENEPGRPETDVSGVFWIGRTPELLAKIERHNRRLGGRAQQLIQSLFYVYFLGPLLFIFLKLFTRFRSRGRGYLGKLHSGGIFACQHFLEWDPFITYIGVHWWKSFLRPSQKPLAIAGRYWVSTRPRRFLSYCLGVLGVARGEGVQQPGLNRAVEMLSKRKPATIAIFPTGPLRHRTSYKLQYGVGFLALACPDTPVFPVAVRGVRRLRLRSLLCLKRPPIEVSIGKPFFGRDISARNSFLGSEAVCAKIREFWESGPAGAEEAPQPS